MSFTLSWSFPRYLAEPIRKPIRQLKGELRQLNTSPGVESSTLLLLRPPMRRLNLPLTFSVLAAAVFLAGPGLALAQGTDAATLAKQKNCMACHAPTKKLIGPAFVDIANKYRGDDAARAVLVKHVRQGSVGVWGSIPMPSNPVSEAEAQRLVGWILEQR